MNGRHDFSAFVRTLNAGVVFGTDEDDHHHQGIAKEHWSDSVIDEHRFPSITDRVLSKYGEGYALFPDADVLEEMGFDKELITKCLVSGKLSAVMIGRMVSRVRSGDGDVEDANQALRTIASSVDVRLLHRDLQILGALGFDVANLRLLVAHGVMNGNRVRALVHNVCRGRLTLDEANTGLSINADYVRKGICSHCC